MRHESPRQRAQSACAEEEETHEETHEEWPPELTAGPDIEAAIGDYIAQLCGELAQMAAKAEYNSLANLLFRAQIEAELWVKASHD
jgi:hypothetical protein